MEQRWWDDRSAAAGIAGLWDSGDDPSMLAGTAALVLHAVGSASLGAAARDYLVTRGSLPAALLAIEDDPLIGAVCKAFDDASGVAGYGAARVAVLKSEADAGARTVFHSLVAGKVPVPVAMARAALSYGVPASDAAVISKRMDAHDLVASHVADRALMAWAGLVAEAEMQTIAKLEKDQFEVDGLLRTVNRDEAGRFAAKDSSAEAKEQRRQERLERFMSASQQRQAKAQRKAGGVGAVAQAPLEQAAVAREVPQAVAQQEPEQQQRKERMERKLRIMARSKRSSAAQQQKRAKVEAEAKDRLRREFDALDAMHAAQSAEMARIAEQTKQTEAVVEARRKEKAPKPKQNQPAAVAYQARKLPKMRAFDSGDPSSTARTTQLVLPGGRSIGLRAPMMLMPQDGEQASAGMENPDPTAVVAMYLGYGNDISGYEKTRAILSNKGSPAGRAALEEVEDVHRYLNLLTSTKGDIGRVLQIAEDTQRTNSATLLAAHFSSGDKDELRRDIKVAEQLARNSALTGGYMAYQKEENAKLEAGMHGASSVLWSDEKPVDYAVQDFSARQDANGVFSLAMERTAMEDDAYIVADSDDALFRTYGEMMGRLAWDTRDDVQTNQQLVRLVRAAQIYALVEPGGEQSRRSSRLQFQSEKVIGHVNFHGDDAYELTGIGLEDLKDTVENVINEAAHVGEEYTEVQLMGMDYVAPPTPRQSGIEALRTYRQQVLTAKDFDRNEMLLSDMPPEYGTKPLPLLPAWFQSTQKSTQSAPHELDDALAWELAEDWRGMSEHVARNTKEFAAEAMKKIKGHNKAEDDRAAQAKQPPWQTP